MTADRMRAGWFHVGARVSEGACAVHLGRCKAARAIATWQGAWMIPIGWWENTCHFAGAVRARTLIPIAMARPLARAKDLKGMLLWFSECNYVFLRL